MTITNFIIIIIIVNSFFSIKFIGQKIKTSQSFKSIQVLWLQLYQARDEALVL